MKKIFALAASVVLITVTGAFAAESDEPGVFVFENVRVLPMTGDDPIESARVVVQDDKVITVEAMDAGSSPADATVIDGSGKTLTPGLADMHVHYWPETGPLYIANGVTTVRGPWGTGSSQSWDDSAKAGTIVAPHFYFSGPLMDGPEPIWGEGSIRISSVEEVKGAIEAQRAAGFKAVKLYERLTPEIFKAAVAAAKEAKMQVWTHTPGGMTYEEVIALGVDSMEHLNNVQDLVIPDDEAFLASEPNYMQKWAAAEPEKMAELAKKTADAGVWNAPTYSVTMQEAVYAADPQAFLARPESKFLGPGLVGWWMGSADPNAADELETARAAAAGYKKMIKALYDADAPLLIGTDSPNPFTSPAFAIHDELAAFVDAGIPVEDVLRIATAEAAKFFGEEGQWGVVAPDTRADLVLLDADPTDDLSTYRRPVGVMMNGHWYDRGAIEAGLGMVLADVARQKEEAAKAQQEAQEAEQAESS